MDKEKRNRLVLGLLLVILLGVLAWRLMPSDGSPAPAKGSSTPSARGPNVATAARGKAANDEQGYRPLAVSALEKRHAVETEPYRNIFVYYVPPPKPIVKPPEPPAPLQITTVQPTSVYAKTGDFTLRVTGAQLPADSRLFVNGQLMPSQVAPTGEISGSIPRSMLGAPGQLTVQIRDASNQLYSNKLTVSVMDPPRPPYRYVGRIDNLAFLSGGGVQADERIPLLLGTTIDSRWKLAQITDETLTIEDVSLRISHQLQLSKEGAGPGNTSSGGQEAMSESMMRLREARRALLRQRGIETTEESNEEEEQQQQLIQPTPPPQPPYQPPPQAPQQIPSRKIPGTYR